MVKVAVTGIVTVVVETPVDRRVTSDNCMLAEPELERPAVTVTVTVDGAGHKLCKIEDGIPEVALAICAALF